MDADRFDAVVQSLGSPLLRRAALGGVLGAGLGAVLDRLGIEDAAAKRKKRRKKKRRKKKRKQRCRAFAVRCRGRCCRPGQRCEDPGSGCVNGDFAVGDACDPDLPGQCASGNCGCDGDACSCRIAACSVTGCDLDIECCQGRCVNRATCAGG